MNVVCPYCRTDGHIDDKFSGREIRCPKCQQIFVAGHEEPPSDEVFAVQEENPVNDEAIRHLQWYYAHDNKPTGPLSNDDFQNLVVQGVITPETLVWNQTLPGWQQHGSLSAGADAHATKERPVTNTSSGTEHPRHYLYNTEDADDGETMGEHIHTAICSQCQSSFAHEEMTRVGSVTLCSTCKPLYYEKIRQEVALPPHFQSAGFLVRFVAKLIDSMIIVVAGSILSYIMGLVFPSLFGEQALTITSVKGGHSLMELILGAGYSTFFVGRFAATPGKMALGLKIITPTGGKLTYLKALGRYGGELLSTLTLCIGYIMVAFDSEKRALHDRICGTRVVKEQD